MGGGEPPLSRRRFVGGSLASLAVSGCGASSFAPATPVPGGRYSTRFEGRENPLSEGGVWSHRGFHWARVQKKDGLAFGTQSGSGGYDDSYAYLAGLAADHQGEAVVHVAPTLRGEPHEALLLLRWADSATSARGYECLFSFDGGFDIVRWNGPYGDFTSIGQEDARLGRTLATGDVLRARIVGPAITCFVNDAQVGHATDATWRDGQPGIGFFRRETGENADIAFSSYTATSVRPG